MSPANHHSAGFWRDRCAAPLCGAGINERFLLPAQLRRGIDLARVIRVYQKKRGHRLTGSRVVGSAGEAILSAAFIVMGCVGFRCCCGC